MGLNVNSFHRIFISKLEKRDALRAPTLITIVTQKHNGQRVFVARYATALGYFAAFGPWAVELAAAHLA
jgi:hypothetical protein